jgi:hypothetical protein
MSQLLVPKLCLGTQLSSKLCFAAWQQSCRDNVISQTEFGNEEAEDKIVRHRTTERAIHLGTTGFRSRDEGLGRPANVIGDACLGGDKLRSEPREQTDQVVGDEDLPIAM